MQLSSQLRSIIQWENPAENQLFYRFSEQGEEIKTASKLIIHPGQGCLLICDGKIEAHYDEEGLYDIETSNIPFITTIKNLMNNFESAHKVSFWFYRNADIANVRWGTRIPITYVDPIYSFVVNLRGFGNYSIKITEAVNFFKQIVAGKNHYTTEDLQQLILSRITQPISNYLANSQFSYNEITRHLEQIAEQAKDVTSPIFEQFGFSLLDFRIEGASFDEATNQRIAEIADMQAEVHSAKIAGVDYAELQKLKAMRDMATNEGAAGTTMGIFTALDMQQALASKLTTNATKNNADSVSVNSEATESTDTIKHKLIQLKELFDLGLIDEKEYQQKKASILEGL